MNLMLLLVLGLAALFAGMLLLVEGGRRIGVSRRQNDPEGANAGLAAVDGAVFGLMGLLIAFTFSGAAARFDARRQLIVAEANAIGTAYLRLDLLPANAQPKLRDNFRTYVDTRLAIYRKIPDFAAVQGEIQKANALQGVIWTDALVAARETGSPGVLTLVASSLNDVIDITATRAVAVQTHPPLVVYVLFMVMMLASALLAGYGMAGAKQRSWIHIAGFALLMTTVAYVILDLEFPRFGLIRIDAADRILVEARESMK